eukprot:3830763-Amphidinium_carterae.1
MDSVLLTQGGWDGSYRAHRAHLGSKGVTTRAHNQTPQTADTGTQSTGRSPASRCNTRPLAVSPHSTVAPVLVAGLRSHVLLVAAGALGDSVIAAAAAAVVGVPGLLGVVGILTASANPATGAFSR